MIIGIDFDGTCVTHDFPYIGKDIGSQSILKQLIERGHKLVLFTMRSDVVNPTSNDPDTLQQSGNYLQDAIDWFEKNDIPLWGIQVNPEQHTWTSSPKAYCQLYIDDAALGCPLTYGTDLSSRPFVNWNAVEKILIDGGMLKQTNGK